MKKYIKSFLKSFGMTLLIISPFLFLALYAYLYYIVPLQMVSNFTELFKHLGGL